MLIAFQQCQNIIYQFVFLLVGFVGRQFAVTIVFIETRQTIDFVNHVVVVAKLTPQYF